MRIAATALALAASLSLAGCHQYGIGTAEEHDGYCDDNPGICLLVGKAVVGGVLIAASSAGEERLSDLRLKHDVEYLTTLDNGVRLHAFSYLGSDDTFVGVVAQDLLADERFADAVRIGGDGYYRVDYGRLGLGLHAADAMRAAGAAAVALAGS